MDEREVVIRDAKPSDAAAIASTHITCWQEAYNDLLPASLLSELAESFERRRTFWGKVVGAPGANEALLVADSDGEVVGFVHVCPSRDDDGTEGVGEVTAIYLRKSQWGGGVGRELFARASERLRGFGFGEATLWVMDTNQRARRFYEAAGCTLDGHEKETELHGTVLRELRYRTGL